MRTVIHYLTALMMGIGLTGCQVSPMKNEAEIADLAGCMWRLSSLAELENTDAAATTLHFEDKVRISGFDGCNNYRASYSASGTSLHVSGDMMATMMACPQAVERQANAFKSALKNAVSFEMDDKQLQLLDGKGKILAAFEAINQSLTGTSWEVVSYNNGKQAVVSLIPGSQIDVSFGTDSKVTGSAGCNRFFAAFQETDGVITIGQPGATRRYCAEPAGIMQQEQSFMAAMQSANNFQLVGDRLTLRTRQGSIAMSLSKSR